MLIPSRTEFESQCPNSNKSKKKMIPTVGKIYTCFDDGKIKRSRMFAVEIKEIVPFNEADDSTLEYWKTEKEGASFLYNKETDYFIRAISKDEGFGKEHFFVRCVTNGWFSLGWWASRLDIDDTLIKRL